MRTFLLLFLFANSAFAQLQNGNPFYAAGLLQPAAAGGGGGLSWANLTSGSDTTTEPTSTASITPTANADVFVAIGIAVAGGGTTVAADTMSVSGCNLTWAEVGERVYYDGSDRRSVYVWHGKGASPTTGVLTLDWTGGGTWTEHMWSVDEVTGAHTSTPYSNVALVGYDGIAATSITITVGGTVDSGDHVYFMCAHDNDETVTLEASLTSLAAVVGGTDVRTFNAGYDGTPTIDQTPSASWTTSSGFAGIAFIVEKAP